jgi:dienelactone hydrolase
MAILAACLLGLHLCPGHATVAVVNKTVSVSGLLCDGNQTAWVLRPDDDDQKYPLISFAHGLNAWNAPIWFPQLLTGLAAEGYVVVAPMAGTGWCQKQAKDQIRALEWAIKDPDLSPHIDAKAGTGVVGHSMGGGSTVTSSGNAAAIKKYNIQVAVAMHPAPSLTDPKVPILFLTGDKDTTVSPTSVEEMYNRTHGVEKSFAEVHGSSHIDATGWPSQPEGCKGSPGQPGFVCNGPNHEDPYVYDWLSCKLKADDKACARVTSCSQPHLTASICHHQPASI